MTSMEDIGELLAGWNQQHLLAFAEELTCAQRERLLAEIDELDFDQLDGLIRSHVLCEPEVEIPDNIAPPKVLPVRPTVAPKDGSGPSAEDYAEARRCGAEAIAAGRVAALVVAGGVGTRLGYDGPKGCLPATPVRQKSLFEVFAGQILAASRRYGSPIPWCVMTSTSNDEATRDFFRVNGFFGLAESDVLFFTQGRLPAIALDGKILLAAKGEIAWNPDGHGGCLTALRRSGVLEELARRGVEHISYFQVDNPLVRCIDPLFIGLHVRAGAEMSAKSLPKSHPLERVGNFCRVDGKTMVIEYSDLPDELARATRSDGALLLGAGSIGIHVFERTFIERLTQGGQCLLPFHRANKAVPHISADGELVDPDQPNAVKLERFIFDALPLAQEVVLLETERGEEFSPVKAASGADSLASCLHDQVARAADWLESAGVAVPRDADGQVAAAIEISPLFAAEPADLAGKVDPAMDIRPGDRVYLE